MKASVLLVEDEADAHDSLMRAFVRGGYQCAAVATRQEALDQVERTFFDLIVSDIILGHDADGGLELLLELKQRGARAPVVLITAFADVAKLKLAINRGAAYLLEKPFRAQELLWIVEQLLATPPDLGHQVEQVLLRIGLTDKERTVARHLLKGLTSQEIATLESNSDKTIRQHITRIYTKCGVNSRAEFFHFVLPV